MTKFNFLAVAGAAAMAAAGAAQAVPVGSTVSSSVGTTYDAKSLTGFQTTGDDMAGSLVTVFFQGGTSATANWVTTGFNSGSASANGWSLGLSGDSFSNEWTLSNNRWNTEIVGFSFNGVPGNTVFDIIGSPDDSPNSASGKAFGSADASYNSVSFATAAYSNRLAVNGQFYGDMYTLLTVSFRGSLGYGDRFQFIADTDNASAATGGITPSIPEPETYALMLAGLGVIGYVARRRKS